MILALIFVITALLGLLLIIYLAKDHLAIGGNLDELAAQLQPIDVDAFRNLIDEREEEFLRDRLPWSEFRSIHRERMLAAVEYVWCAARNTSILIRLGEAAKQSSDPAVSAAAEKLLDNALRLRLYAFEAIPRFYLGILFPHTSRKPYLIAETYDIMTRQVVMLCCLHYPTRGMSSVL